MADNKQQIDSGLADSIAMLEQILEVMPQDADAIKGLYRAYLASGSNDRAFEYLGKLVDIAASGGDGELVEYLQKEFSRFEEDYPIESAAHRARLRTLNAAGSAEKPATLKKAGASSASGEDKAIGDVDISEEIALAWRLYEESQLSQEEYSSVLHDLTEISSKELDVPVSVLHVLHDRGFTQMNRIMNYLSSRSGVPAVSLANFELDDSIADVLPLERAARDGALPFGFFGNDLQIAVLNPFNHALVDQVESDCGHRCHTYLVSSEDYDAALERFRALVA